MKKCLSLLLVLVLIFSFTVQSFASSGGMPEKLIDDLEDNLEDIAKKVTKVPEIAKDAKAAAEAVSGFKSFMENMRYAGIAFSVINGSVTFLKMVGVIKDSNEEALTNIRVLLQTMDERLYEMDAKLTDITNRMAQMQSSIDFNARTHQAILMESNWNDFSYRYMEEGLDKLMDEYDAMLKNGLISWCKNDKEDSRNKNDIDTSSIYVLYKKTATGYQLVFSAENEVPSYFTKDDRYVVISSECIPQSVSWNVNTYNYDIYNQIYQMVYNSLYSKDHNGLEISNYDELVDNIHTKSGSSLVKQLAEDAVSTLIYRIAASQINNSAEFTNNVIRAYTNYCNHLGASDDGIDAVLKTFYLTHAFEGDVATDITDFLNRMTVKNGVYGVFVTNVLSSSQTATTTALNNALEQFNKSMNVLKGALANSITGYKDYCYLTNTRIYLSSIEFDGQVTVSEDEEASSGRRTYNGFYSASMGPLITQDFVKGSYMMSDSTLLLLEKTALSNGDTITFDYLKAHTNSAYTYNYGKIVTSYSDPIDFTPDGKTKLSVRNIAGDYFEGKSEIFKLPEDASADYLKYKKKITGTYYDLSTNSMQSSQVLLANAVFGEDHWYWRISETAILSGPFGYENYYGGVSTTPGSDTFERIYILKSSAKYNMLMCSPVNGEFAQGNDLYNPLESLAKLNASLAEQTQKEEPLRMTPVLAIIIILAIAAIAFLFKCLIL